MKLKKPLNAGLFLLVSLLATAQAPSFLKGNEVQAYQQHASEVTLLANAAVGEEMARMTLNGHIRDAAKLADIRSLLYEQETRKATYHFIHPDDEVARYESRQRITKEYRKPLVRKLFLAGEIVGSYNCCMVMRNKDTLRLSPTQQAAMAEVAVEVDQRLKDDPAMDLRGYELAAFRKIM
ncbi:MAG: hypothetical protein GX619_10475, partial [Bacteroidales bacterium]|nr:hypothetical protein [Bacteroidales bacterium]